MIQTRVKKQSASRPSTTRAIWDRPLQQKLKRRCQGFDADIDENDTVAILGLDSATKGRLSVIFYMEQLWPEYRFALESWQNDMVWWIRRTREADAPPGKKKKTEVFWKETAPTPLEIALAAYGKRIDDQLKKNAVERLLPCIAGKRPVPFDLVTCCVSRACNRAGLDNWEWEMALGVACAMYKGYCARHPLEKQRRKHKMGLDETNTSRDYLYGRLLAVAERIERVALSVAEEKRPTNAERLMQRFADCLTLHGPSSTRRYSPTGNACNKAGEASYAIWTN